MLSLRTLRHDYDAVSVCTVCAGTKFKHDRLTAGDGHYPSLNSAGRKKKKKEALTSRPCNAKSSFAKCQMHTVGGVFFFFFGKPNGQSARASANGHRRLASARAHSHGSAHQVYRGTNFLHVPRAKAPDRLLHLSEVIWIGMQRSARVISANATPNERIISPRSFPLSQTHKSPAPVTFHLTVQLARWFLSTHKWWSCACNVTWLLCGVLNLRSVPCEGNASALAHAQVVVMCSDGVPTSISHL